MPRIEFSEPASPDDEELDPARRRLPRWVVLVAVALVALVAVVVVVDRSHGGDGAAPASSASTPTLTFGRLRTSSAPSTLSTLSTSPTTTVPSLPPIVGVGPRIVVGPITSIDDIAVARDDIWVVSGNRLYHRSPSGRVRSLYLDVTFGDVTAVHLDPGGGLIWVVSSSPSHGGHVTGYDLRNATMVADADIPPVESTVPLDGRLYLARGRRLWVLAVNGRLQPLAQLGRPIASLTADPSRHRFLALDSDVPATVWSVHPGDPRSVRKVAGAIPDVVTGVSVAAGRVWVSGVGGSIGGLFRIDPTTLRPIPGTGVDQSFGSGAVVVATGASVLWVRDGNSAADGALRCVDARSGRILQTWQVYGAVASAHGRAVVATVGGVAPLLLRGCRG